MTDVRSIARAHAGRRLDPRRRRRLARQALLLIQRGLGTGGAIVSSSSIYGVPGKAAHHAYVASKHAVLGLTRSVALEHAKRGIRVNAICAGVTSTASMRAAEAVVPEIVHALVAEHPMDRMATEDEVAGATLWLCSDAAGFVTGAPLLVDGGFLAA